MSRPNSDPRKEDVTERPTRQPTWPATDTTDVDQPTQAVPTVAPEPGTVTTRRSAPDPRGAAVPTAVPHRIAETRSAPSQQPPPHASTMPVELPAEVPSDPVVGPPAPNQRPLRRPVIVPLRRRPRVRRVTRVVRSVDTWSVFKISLLFFVLFYISSLLSAVLLWNVAHVTGTVDNIERFLESFGWETFEFNGGQIYRAAWVIGLFLVVGLTGLAVLAATTFNLITDLVGGLRVTVLEEEIVVRSPAGPQSPPTTG